MSCQYALYEHRMENVATFCVYMENTSKKAIAARLKDARERAGFRSAKEFSKSKGLTGSTYGSHENGTRGLDLHVLGRYAKLLNVSTWWLATGEEVRAELNPDLLPVPSYNAYASAGHGRWNEGVNQTGTLYFKRDWLRSVTSAPIEKLAVVEVVGDSMENTLHPGDHVLVDLTRQIPNDDGMYVVQYDGCLLVKRITIDHHRRKVRLSSDNPAYPPIEPYDAGEIKVEGRVIWFGRRV